MDSGQRTRLSEVMGAGIIFDCPMDGMTTYRVGGKAEACCFPGELKELRNLIAFLTAEDVSYCMVGKGSNILVSDDGIKGVVIVLKDGLASIEDTDTEGPGLLCGGGATVSALLGCCRKKGLAGLEFMAGIPGTVGGAVFMNAGAHGNEIGNFVREIHAVKPDGEEIVFKGEEIRFTYRSSGIPQGMAIYRIRLGLKRGERDEISEMIARNLKKRKESQPLDYPSAGSVFRNPTGDYAWRLIEKVGLKGAKIGGAMISAKHANFIVNAGGARASDIMALMELARSRVKAETGIDLTSEIKIIGF